MESIAIVGTGISGLGCAWHLKDRAKLTLLEQDARAGGHTNTVTVDENGTSIPIDTGFIVFNKVTYPHLTKLFGDLGISIKPAEMSFSVQHLGQGLEYNGMGLHKVFAQWRNLLRPRFHRFLGKVGKFFAVAKKHLDDPSQESMTLREFSRTHDLGEDFLEWYLVPMGSAVWSADPRKMLDFPAANLIRFFHNHGFLGVTTHHPWYTVDGGAKSYVQKILGGCGAPRLNAKVVEVNEHANGAEVRVENGETLSFDRVILACHADQALRMLKAPTPQQQKLLAPFHYQHNHAILHTDATVMPKKRRAWAAWNYRVASGGPPTTHYWMNALQGVSKARNYFVSLNSRRLVAPEAILYQTDYEHPVYTLDTAHAQMQLPSLNQAAREQRVFFCGSYFRHGFHEDAYRSAVECSRMVSEVLGAP